MTQPHKRANTRLPFALAVDRALVPHFFSGFVEHFEIIGAVEVYFVALAVVIGFVCEYEIPASAFAVVAQFQVTNVVWIAEVASERHLGNHLFN